MYGRVPSPKPLLFPHVWQHLFHRILNVHFIDLNLTVTNGVKNCETIGESENNILRRDTNMIPVYSVSFGVLMWVLTPALRTMILFHSVLHRMHSWFGLPPAFKLLSCSAYSSTLKRKAITSSETSVDYERTIRCYTPEDITLLYSMFQKSDTIWFRVAGQGQDSQGLSNTLNMFFPYNASKNLHIYIERRAWDSEFMGPSENRDIWVCALVKSTIQSPVTIACTTSFNTLKLCILPTQWICVFRMVLTVNRDCLPKLR
jgi:hypothetical protein